MTEGSETQSNAGDEPVTVPATEAVAAVAIAELAHVRAEYAAFRANVVRVGQEEAAERDWCGYWRTVAVKMGLRPDELPPSHATVAVKLGGTEINLRLQYDGYGKITRELIIAALGEELRYGNGGQSLRRDESWYTITPEAPSIDDDH